MSMTHGKGTAVLFNQYDLSSYCDNADIAGSVEVAETTTYGTTGSAKTYIVGLKDSTLALTGKADFASGASDAILVASHGASANDVVTVGLEGTTIGSRCKMGAAIQTGYTITAPVADVVSWSADSQLTGPLDTGHFLHALGPETGVGNYTSVDGAAASTGGYAGHLHVTAMTGTSATIKLQHSTDNSTFADLAAFTAVTGVTKERISGTGTVNRYLRAAITAVTSLTSITFAVAGARR